MSRLWKADKKAGSKNSMSIFEEKYKDFVSIPAATVVKRNTGYIYSYSRNEPNVYVTIYKYIRG